MKPEDQFLKKMQPLSSRSRLVLNDDDRFGEYNRATIGFLLVGGVVRAKYTFDLTITVTWDG